MPDLSLVRFQADIRAFSELLRLTQAEVMQKIASDVWSRIVGNFEGHRHPVRTGRARAGWGLSIGSPNAPAPPPATDELNAYGPPSTPGFETLDGTQIAYILNALPYIERLEDGWSQQAPNGFVRLAILEVEAEIDTILALNR